MTRRAPRVLVIGGLEPTGRMGLLADVEQVRALGGRPVAVASAITAQGRRTFSVLDVPARTIAKQIRAALEIGPIDAVKLGMMPTKQSLSAVRRALSTVRVPWVIDPVVRTSKGETLSRLSPGDYRALAAPHVVLTPNAGEAAWLLEESTPPRSVEHAVAMAHRLREIGFGFVIVKGGHLRGDSADAVVSERGTWRMAGPRLRRTKEHRGTGCRFASALAVFLARGEAISVAARRAKREVEKYLRAPILGLR